MAALYQLFASSPSPTAVAGETVTTWGFSPQNPCGSGNRATIALYYDNHLGAVPTLKLNGVSQGSPAVTTPGGSTDTSVWDIKNLSAGVANFLFTFTGAVQPVWLVYVEHSGLDTSAGNSGTASAGNVTPASHQVQTGAFVPTDNFGNGGNLILAFFNDAFGNDAGPTTFTSGGSFSLLEANNIWQYDGQGQPSCSEFFIQTGHSSSINPSVGIGTDTTHYNCTAIALPLFPGAGTPVPAGQIWPVKVIRHVLASTTTHTSLTLQAPSVGNARAHFNTNTNTESGITDSDGNTWVNETQSVNTTQMFYAKNTTPNPNLTITVSVAANSTFNTTFVDFMNAAPSTLIGAVAHVDTTGTTATQTSISNQPTITPISTNSCVIACVANGQGPTNAVTSPTGARSINMILDTGDVSESDAGTTNSGDNLAMVSHNTSLSTQNFDWTITPPGSANTFWSAAYEFLSAPPVVASGGTLPLTGVG